MPSVFRETEEKDWLLGFGYNPVRSTRSRLDFDAGVRVDFPVDPFFKGTWRYYAFMNEQSLLRVAQTVFWTNQLEFGTTTRLDAERVLGENFHLRWQGLGTAAQETEGVDWRTSLILYQNLGNLRAIAWEAEVEGETDAEIHLDHYGVRATYRQRIFRDDLFLELQAAGLLAQIDRGARARSRPRHRLRLRDVVGRPAQAFPALGRQEQKHGQRPAPDAYPELSGQGADLTPLPPLPRTGRG